MKFDIKQSFIVLVISLIFVILFSSYLGIYMKEGFEDEDLGDFSPPEVKYDEFQEEAAPKDDFSDAQDSYEAYLAKAKKDKEELEKADAEFKAQQAKDDDMEAADDAEEAAEKKAAEEKMKKIQAAIAAGIDARAELKKEITALDQKSSANKAAMGNLDFIPSSDRGKFAQQSMVTNFFNTQDQKIESAKSAALTADTKAEAAKAQAMAAMNKANQAPPAPDLSGYATKQMFGQMNQRLGGYAKKADLNPFATKAEIGNLATKAQLGGYATQADLDAKVQSAGKGNFATQEQLNDLRNEFNSKFLKHGDEITIRSRKTGRRLQDRGWGRFANHNRMWWERFHIEKCGQPGMYDKRPCR